MKSILKIWQLGVLAVGLWGYPLRAGQSYSVVWDKVAPPSPSTGGVYSAMVSLSPPATPMTSGPYSVTGGFSSLIQVVQTVGLPNLTLTHTGNTVTVLWPVTSSVTLQQNANLTNPAGWNASPLTVTTSKGTSSVTVTQATGNMFFRLSSP